MAFGICRIRNLKLADISSTDTHNARRYESVEEYPTNINAEGKNITRYLAGNDGDFLYKDQITLGEALQYRIEKNNVVGQRSNSNVAIEYVLAVNDKNAWENYSPEGYFQNCLNWLEERHGKGSVIAISEHYDESNPHAHFVVVPLVEKDVKWKNRSGEGVKKETRIDTRSWTGGREKLRALQDDYHQFVKGFESKMGVEFHRGTLVENQTKSYIQKTDHRIGKLRANLERLEKENPSVTEKVIEAFKSFKNTILELTFVQQVFKKTLVEETQRKKEENKKGYWKKKSAEEEYFHSTKTEKSDKTPKNTIEKPKNKGMQM
jgi:hypothetical protein